MHATIHQSVSNEAVECELNHICPEDGPRSFYSLQVDCGDDQFCIFVKHPSALRPILDAISNALRVPSLPVMAQNITTTGADDVQNQNDSNNN